MHFVKRFPCLKKLSLLKNTRISQSSLIHSECDGSRWRVLIASVVVSTKMISMTVGIFSWLQKIKPVIYKTFEKVEQSLLERRSCIITLFFRGVKKFPKMNSFFSSILFCTWKRNFLRPFIIYTKK